MKKNYIKRSGERVFILSKFDGNNDWQCVFDKTMANKLYTFKSIGLINNPNTIIDISKIMNDADISILSIGSDCIGPVNVKPYGFIGANHLYNNFKTAKTDYFEIYADGQALNDGEEMYCNEVLVVVNNTIFEPQLLPVESGLITEKVFYKISDKSIDVTVKHTYLKNIFVALYYGMQSVTNNLFSKIAYSNSQHIGAIDYVKAISSDSGLKSLYPNVDKITLSNGDGTICQSMIMNKIEGLGAFTNSNVYATTQLAFTSTTYGKIYFRLINNKPYTAGQSNFWEGVYSWYNIIY